jgi:multidrug efflux pump subunit AcrA (membrane-fusion protein)
MALGQKVALTIDALKSWAAAGTVSYIAPAATITNGVVTYAVRVSFPDSEARVKVGMTANLVITTAEHANVLVVPTSALLPKGAGSSVKLRSADGKTTTEVDVQTGLSDGVNTEIVSGLKAGDTIGAGLLAGDRAVLRHLAGAPRRTAQPDRRAALRVESGAVIERRLHV